MTVTVNGQARHLDAGSTVADVVAMLGRDPARAGVAVAVDGALVPQRQWAEHLLAEGARVEIVGAVQGG